MIIDAHVHFWNPSAFRYPWLEGSPSLQRAFSPADYHAATDGRVDRLVFVEANCAAGQSRDETAYVERLACTDTSIAAIVAFADVLDAGLGAVLDDLAARPLVRGVRHNIQGHDAGFCRQPRFVEGVREAGRRGFTFDICITEDQLEDAAALARACADTPFVLDHGGKPRIAGSDVAIWSERLSRLAACDNVCCKLSGLMTEADASHRTPAHLLPYAECIIEQFGIDRVMFGSDWPVLTTAGDFGGWFDFVQSLAATWTPSERERLFGGTAAAVYGISLQ